MGTSSRYPRNEFATSLAVPGLSPQQQNAVRIRCFDAAALKATLQWYACSVFTNENARYIDTYQWDEKMADFDPRVFQAFLWTDAAE